MKTLKFLKNRTLALISLAIIFTACNSNKQQQEDLQKSVIAVHDSVMTDMNTVMEKKMAITKLLTHIDSLKAKNTSLDTVQARIELTQTVKDLAAADEEMMNWMHNFNPDYTGKSHEEVMTYLNDQKVKINSVESSIKKAIAKSDSVIVKY